MVGFEGGYWIADFWKEALGGWFWLGRAFFIFGRGNDIWALQYPSLTVDYDSCFRLEWL